MKDAIRLNELGDLFEKISDRMTEQSDLLCEMDARLGDGDLGLTMKKGFGALPEIFREMQCADIGKALVSAGMKMASIVPSTMGTLMASGIMSGGKTLVGHSEMDAAGFVTFLGGFCDGIQKRGKCARGDCTILDALAAAYEAALPFADGSLEQAVNAAVTGAGAGVEETKHLRPKFGKAAVHAAAADGTVDQGACAGLYFLEGVRAYVCG